MWRVGGLIRFEASPCVCVPAPKCPTALGLLFWKHSGARDRPRWQRWQLGFRQQECGAEGFGGTGKHSGRGQGTRGCNEAPGEHRQHHTAAHDLLRGTACSREAMGGRASDEDTCPSCCSSRLTRPQSQSVMAESAHETFHMKHTPCGRTSQRSSGSKTCVPRVGNPSSELGPRSQTTSPAPGDTLRWSGPSRALQMPSMEHGAVP